jgi:hypothetical protein
MMKNQFKAILRRKSVRAFLVVPVLACTALLASPSMSKAGFYNLPAGQNLGGGSGNTIEIQ